MRRVRRRHALDVRRVATTCHVRDIDPSAASVTFRRMEARIRFALFAAPARASAAFEEMAEGIFRGSGLSLEPLFVPSYAALSQAFEVGACDVAWSPPMVAQGLLASGVGRPLVAVGREGRTSYFAVLLARAESTRVGVAALSGARVGWVSKLSAAGYRIPSLYLQSLGLEPDDLFARQSFFGSHENALRALSAGEVDVAATHASLGRGGRTLILPEQAPPSAKVVTIAGPIPGDVIFAASELDARRRDRLLSAFLTVQVKPEGPLASLMSVDRFEIPLLDHFETLRRWRARAVESEPPVASAAVR